MTDIIRNRRNGLVIDKVNQVILNEYSLITANKKCTKEDERNRNLAVGRNLLNILTRKYCCDKAPNQFCSEIDNTSLCLPVPTLRFLYQTLEQNLLIMNNDDAAKPFGGKVCNVSLSLIQILERNKPAFSARVADENENLSFNMPNERGSLNIIKNARKQNECQTDESLPELVCDFEKTLKSLVDGADNDIEYIGSYLRTEQTVPQPPHVDFTWEVIEKGRDELFIAFFPLTEDGMFLQLWEKGSIMLKDKPRKQHGTLIFIPHGKMLIVPSDTIHGGGFKSSGTGNLRFHLYISTFPKEGGSSALPRFQRNRYTEKLDKRIELSNSYKNAHGLDSLMGLVFDTE